MTFHLIMSFDCYSNSQKFTTLCVLCKLLPKSILNQIHSFSPSQSYKWSTLSFIPKYIKVFFKILIPSQARSQQDLSARQADAQILFSLLPPRLHNSNTLNVERSLAGCTKRMAIKMTKKIKQTWIR